MAVAITGKPDSAVYSLTAPVRGSNGSRQMTASWHVSDWAKSDRNPRRLQGFEIHFTLYCADTRNQNKEVTLKYERKSQNASRTSWTIDLYSLTCKDGKTYRRDTDFWPVGRYILKTIKASVRMYNSKGYGSWVNASRNFEVPRKPSVTTLSTNPTTGEINCTWEHNAGNDYRENWNTVAWIGARDSRYKDKDYIAQYQHTFDTSSDTYSYNWLDIYGRMGLGYDDYITVFARAWSRGIRGTSETVERRIYVSYPMQPTISGYSVSSLDETGKVTLWVNTNYQPYKSSGYLGLEHPVTGIKLQMIKDRTDESASTIPGDDNSWTDLVQDDGQCTAMSALVGTLRSEAGRYTWVRVKSWNETEDIFYRYSGYLRLDKLFVGQQTATEDAVTIISVMAGDDGKSALVTMAWPTDSSTGTEISWSDDENAWRSVREPNRFETTLDDGELTVTESGTSTTWAHSLKMYIPNLNEGEQYYVRARRYRILDDGSEIFGSYSDTSDIIPVTSPPAVVLDVPEYTPAGTDVSISWTYDSEATQREWQLLTGTVQSQTVSGKTVTRIVEDGSEVIVAQGVDPLGSYVIPWHRLGGDGVDDLGLLGSSDSIPIAVRMGTGGELVTSDARTLTVVDAPTMTVTVGSVTAQPMTFDVECSAAASLAVVCTAQGAQTDSPTGIVTQLAGDGIWSDVMMPDWVPSYETIGGEQYISGYSATVTAPLGLSLWDGCQYTLHVTVADEATGLSTQSDDLTVDVDYLRKAPDPSDAISIAASDVTDSDGIRTRSATITLAAPTDTDGGDTYDVYRLTGDGPTMCATGLGMTDVAYDQWAPFGNADLAYRIALVTQDGSCSYRDYQYQFGSGTVFDREIRIDFGNRYVELDRNVDYSETFTKQFELSQRLDGSAVGHWGNGVQRSSQSNAVTLRYYEPDDALRELARYAGPAFVRTSEGLAYAANVDVRVSTGRGTAKEAVGLTLTQVDTDEYWLVTEVEADE